jgi:hypothetical protein
MSNIFFSLLLFASFAFLQSFGYAGNAKIKANVLSFSLYPTTTTQNVELYFTSFDGSTGTPLQSNDGTISAEL